MRARTLAGLCCLLVLAPAATEAAPDPDERTVMVVLRPLGARPADVLPDPERWLNALADAVHGDPSGADALGVRGGFVVDGHVLSFVAGQDLDAYLLRRGEGLRVVLASVTRLVDRYGVEVRLLTPGEPPRRIQTLEGEGTDGLEAALETAGAAVRAALDPVPQANPDDAALVAQSAQSGLKKAPDREDPQSVEEPGEFEAEAPDAEVRPAPDAEARVVEIRVEGTRRTEPDAIRMAIRTRVGDPVASLRLGEDIRRIYERGFFHDVQVVATDVPGGQILTFIVEENPIIRQVSVSGNENLGAEDITEAMTLTAGSTIDYPLLIENKARIAGLYASRGYYQTDVSYEIEPIAEGAVAVNFDIDEGRKLRLVSIDFEGNVHFTDGELRHGLQTKVWGWTSHVSHFWTNAGLYAEPIFYQDLDTIARRYMDEGFIRVRVSEPEISYDDDGLRVRVSIDEGDQYRIGMVDVIGDASMNTDQLLSLVSMEPDQIFSRSGLSEDVETLQGFYADRGFYFAKVTPRTSVDPDTLVVDCAFEVEKGDLYFVDRIEVSGNTRTRDSVVRRELSLAEGELYASNALQRSRARVQRLGFFEEVQLEARPADEPGRVDVDVEVVERPTGSFSFGAGAGSSDGLLLNAAIQQSNLFGRGYALMANADFGSQNQRFFVRFSNPYAFGTNASYGVTGSYSDIDFDDFKQEIVGFDWTIGYPLDEGETRVFSGYSYTSRETTDFSDVSAASMLQREESQGSSSTSFASLSFRRDMRDDPRFPREGYRVGGAMEFAGLGGLNQFLRLEAQGTWFIPLDGWLPFDSTFIVNSRAGYVFTLNNVSDWDLPSCGGDTSDITSCAGFSSTSSQIEPLTKIDTDLKLSLTERYFLGGIGPFQVRGFKARTLGPRRSILAAQGGFSNSKDRTYFPENFSLLTPSGCVDGRKCNNIDDTDIDDFDDLDSTDVIGGNKFMLFNFELRFPVSEELGLEGLVFLDMGNAFSENETVNPADFRFGTGFGAQWFSPFGPILVQLGFPLDRLEDEDSAVFEFSFGGSNY
jgi:outer membrane protein insertion porin family